MVTPTPGILLAALVLFSSANVLSWCFSPVVRSVHPGQYAWTDARLQQPPLSIMSEEQSVDHYAIPNNPPLHSSSNSNKSFVPRPWRRFLQNRRAKMAYRMAVLARLAYYPYYERLVANELFFLGTTTTGEEQNERSFHEFCVTVRRSFRLRFLWCQFRCRVVKLLLRSMTMILDRPPQKQSSHRDQSKACTEWLNKRAKEKANKHRYTLHYSLYGWAEPTPVPGVSYHDTDLIVATSNDNKTLVVAFAGTESPVDHATNIQTFEPIEHSGMFHGGVISHHGSDNSTSFLKGSIHRGFLNAYSRVEQGGVLSLSPGGNNGTRVGDLTHSLDRRFGHCRPKEKERLPKLDRPKLQFQDSENNLHNLLVSSADGISSLSSSEGNVSTEPSVKETTQLESNGACRVEGESLMAILRELMTEALLHGKTVHLSGHSLGT